MKKFFYFIIIILITSCNNNLPESKILKNQFFLSLGKNYKAFSTEKKETKDLYTNEIPEDLYNTDTIGWQKPNYKTGDLIEHKVEKQSQFNFKNNNSITIINIGNLDVYVYAIKVNNYGESPTKPIYYGKYYLKAYEQFTVQNLIKGTYDISIESGKDYYEKEFNTGKHSYYHGNFFSKNNTLLGQRVKVTTNSKINLKNK